MLLIRDVSVFTYMTVHLPQALVICRNPPVDNVLKGLCTNSLRAPLQRLYFKKCPGHM